MKGNWVKMHSDVLNQKIAYDMTSGWLACEDGVRYSPREVSVITRHFTDRSEFPLAVHIIKKTFKGEVVRRDK